MEPSPKLDAINIDAYAFNLEIANTVEYFAQPLFDSFGLTHFGYGRVYNNGQFLRLANNPEWTKKFFENGFYNDQDFFHKNIINIKTTSDTGFFIIPNEPNNDHCKLACDNDVWNLIVLYKKMKDSLEVCCFGTRKENTNIINFYINNIKLLQDFIVYFKNKNLHLIERKDNAPLITTQLTPKISEFDKLDHLKFLESMQLKARQLPSDPCLSSREMQCLCHLAEGYTAKYIAQFLNLSPRTVEFYLSNVKKKTGLKFKNELVNFFHHELSGSNLSLP